jgi:hypothetical protein
MQLLQNKLEVSEPPWRIAVADVRRLAIGIACILPAILGLTSVVAMPLFTFIASDWSDPPRTDRILSPLVSGPMSILLAIGVWLITAQFAGQGEHAPRTHRWLARICTIVAIPFHTFGVSIYFQYHKMFESLNFDMLNIILLVFMLTSIISCVSVIMYSKKLENIVPRLGRYAITIFLLMTTFGVQVLGFVLVVFKLLHAAGWQEWILRGALFYYPAAIVTSLIWFLLMVSYLHDLQKALQLLRR